MKNWSIQLLFNTVILVDIDLFWVFKSVSERLNNTSKYCNYFLLRNYKLASCEENKLKNV